MLHIDALSSVVSGEESVINCSNSVVAFVSCLVLNYATDVI